MANSEIISIDYDELENMKTNFTSISERVETLYDRIKKRVDALLQEGFKGETADAFRDEMESFVFPSLHRMRDAFKDASGKTETIIQLMREHEESASRAVQLDGRV